MKNQNEFIAFGKNIRRMREDNGLTKKEMSKQLGIGVCSLTMIERGILPERLSCDIMKELRMGLDRHRSKCFYRRKSNSSGGFFSSRATSGIWWGSRCWRES